MHDQLLNEFIKLKTNSVGNDVCNDQLIDKSIPMDIGTRFDINNSIICRRKRKCLTIEPLKKVNTVSNTKSKSAKNDSMDLLYTKNNPMTKYFLRLLIVGIEESIKRKKQTKKMHICNIQIINN
uniref:Uncharacterized protein n=1 Tax=Strongyloides stercoralis TaxID=6248 RepID=A0A0K0EC28_STRER